MKALLLTLAIITSQLPENIIPAVPDNAWVNRVIPDHYKIDSEVLRFKIHGHEWRVVLADMSGSMCVGQTEWKDHLIYIERNTVEAERPEILLHELMHALMFERFSDKRMTGHDFIYAMSPALQRALAENPELVKYLVQH